MYRIAGKFDVQFGAKPQKTANISGYVVKLASSSQHAFIMQLQ